ncbi:hypothetical protein Pmani_035943 [Petrolisthes manimaculis]|uniref:Transcription factor Adf-1 n=1 Tax=Petrolisthes manimaculis TaxID=1843537 RepID=A0AAE1NLC5_9EUCA|nr:hypothetical protein Pmani_035943 [Petrolisthes manimaculis]
MSTLDNEKLIHEVSRSSCIWNPSHTQHNDRIFIAQQWERIGDQLNVSGENAKKRFKNLRDQFRLELKKVPTGRAGDPDLPLDQYRKLQNEFLVIEKQRLEIEERRSREEKDSDRMFLLSLLDSVKTLQPRRAHVFRIKVQQLLYEAQYSEDFDLTTTTIKTEKQQQQ